MEKKKLRELLASLPPDYYEIVHARELALSDWCIDRNPSFTSDAERQTAKDENHRLIDSLYLSHGR